MSAPRALLTGATGFIGSRLAVRLLDEGWEVHAIVKVDDLAGLSRLDERIMPHVYDGATDDMVAIAAAARPLVAFHLASLFLARHTSADVTGLIESNVLLGTQLLEGMRECGCAYLVNTGTAWQHHHTAEYRPVCLYAATKQAFEDVCAYYADAEGISVATIKLNDTYGPCDPRPKIMQLLMRAAKSGETLRMSPGEQILDLVYIDDVVNGFVQAASLLVSGTVTGVADFGLPSGEPVTLKALAALVAEVVGRPVVAEFGALPYREREVMEPWLFGTPLPGWTPFVTLTEGIARSWATSGD